MTSLELGSLKSIDIEVSNTIAKDGFLQNSSMVE